MRDDLDPPESADTTARAVRRLLIVEDDFGLRDRLVRAFERESFDVRAAAGLQEAYAILERFSPELAVVDLHLDDGYGLELLRHLLDAKHGTRVVVVTGYDSIASTIVALKAGASDYLAKPVRVEEVVAAVTGRGQTVLDPPSRPMSITRVRWEHVMRVYEQCNRNVSEAARRLQMHRRTLQRLLRKRAPRP